jgi:hypothetical protein
MRNQQLTDRIRIVRRFGLMKMIEIGAMQRRWLNGQRRSEYLATSALTSTAQTVHKPLGEISKTTA